MVQRIYYQYTFRDSRDIVTWNYYVQCSNYQKMGDSLLLKRGTRSNEKLQEVTRSNQY